MTMDSKSFRKSILFAGAFLVLLLPLALYFQSASRHPFPEEALDVVTAYLKATYARDQREAYFHISSLDQRIRDEMSYVQAQGAFDGFTLQLARKLAGFMDIWPVEHKATSDRAQFKVGYRFPATEDLSNFLFNWNPDKLNSLSPTQQKQLVEILETRKNDGKLVTLEGQETFELIKERGAWKLFFDWATGTKVSLKTTLPKNADLEVQLSLKEIIAKADEPFQINLTIKNRSAREVMFTVGHQVDPIRLADHLEMTECGLAVPITLQPGSAQEFSMAYLLGAVDGQTVRQFTLTYEFKLEK